MDDKSFISIATLGQAHDEVGALYFSRPIDKPKAMYYIQGIMCNGCIVHEETRESLDLALEVASNMRAQAQKGFFTALGTTRIITIDGELMWEDGDLIW